MVVFSRFRGAKCLTLDVLLRRHLGCPVSLLVNYCSIHFFSCQNLIEMISASPISSPLFLYSSVYVIVIFMGFNHYVCCDQSTSLEVNQ